jgi:hypothetical protein
VVGSVDKTLFPLTRVNDFLLVQIYMDDIIFGEFSHTLVSSFQEIMKNEFQISMMGELTFFLRYSSQANEARYLCTSSQVTPLCPTWLCRVSKTSITILANFLLTPSFLC